MAEFTPLHRMTDLFLRGWATVNPVSGSFRPEALVEIARRRTGLSDLGDRSYESGLEMLCRSFEDDARLAPVGRVVMREIVVQKLCNRLRIQDALRCHPEIRDVSLGRPLIVVGLARSGTTMLHRLLSSAPDIRSLHLWELWTPAPPPDPATYHRDPRRNAQAYNNSEATGLSGLICRNLGRLLGEERERTKQAIHEWGNDQPEECTHLFMNDFLSCEFGVIANVSSYMRWLYAQDHLPSYRYYREQLQLLTWRFPSQQLVLKSPSHVRGLGALLQVFPDAHVVWIHRDPQAAIPSVSSLVEACVTQYTNEPRPETLGRNQIAYALGDLAAGMAADRRSPGRIFHVGYRALLRDPIETISAIHRRFELPLGDQAIAMARSWLTQNPQHKRGVHVYDLRHFGLSPETIENAFADYLGTYRSLLRD
ncbi:MAG TPA: sulfotransferase [Kofleriaceae bacterium]